MVQKVKYLEVQVDNSLDWKDQIKAISLTVSKALGLSEHAKHFSQITTLSIVEPHFRYCCSVWGCRGSDTL